MANFSAVTPQKHTPPAVTDVSNSREIVASMQSLLNLSG
jgi:hypothetical protein